MTLTVEAAIHAAVPLLAATGDTPRDEAEWLMAELLGSARSPLRFSARELTEPEQQRYQEWVGRRAGGEPFAYVTGTQPFRRLMLQVGPAVLIPRPDTEHLVAWAIEILAAAPQTARVLDACTGSGCVALALADECRGRDITGSDCSAAALAVARNNAARLQLQLNFIEADALALPLATAAFDLITANPPYIAEGDVHLPALHHEPTLALVSGADGLDLLRRLIQSAPGCLKPDGWLLLEHGHDQGERVRALLAARGFGSVETRRDYGGNERVTGGQWPLTHA